MTSKQLEKVRKSVKDTIPESPLDQENGWLDREGQLYACGWADHIWLARRICAAAGIKRTALEKAWSREMLHDGEKKLEERGWIKITLGKPNMPHRLTAKPEFRKLSKDQFDFCLEYLSHHIQKTKASKDMEADPARRRTLGFWMDELLEHEP